jgi:hypothetical protein
MKVVIVRVRHSTVDRELGFFSSRSNWDHPTHSPAGECVPSSFGSGGWDTIAYDYERGSGGSQFGRGDRNFGSFHVLLNTKFFLRILQIRLKLSACRIAK